MLYLIMSLVVASALPGNTTGAVLIPEQVAGGVLHGTVTSRRGPIEGAEVSIEGLGSRLSDREGHFTFRGIPVGMVVMRTSHLGFVTRHDTVSAGGGVLDLVVPLAEEAIALEPIVVTVHQAGGRMADFLERRRTERGIFLTRAEFERRHPMRISDILREVPGISIDCSGNECRVGMRRAAPSLVSDPASGSGCPVQVFVDGAAWRSEGWLDAEFSPNEIEALEVYRGPSETPARYNSARSGRCGVIVIWTRTVR